MRRLLALGACALALAALLALSGCGGDGDNTSSTAPSTAESTTAIAPGSSREGTAAQEGKGKEPDSPPTKNNSGDSDSSPQSTATVKVPPISSAPIAGSEAPAPGVKTVKGGDNSVQTYGVEADEAARTEAAIALQAYLNARTEEDWGRVCAGLAQRAKEQLETFIQSDSKQSKDIDSCADAMAAFGKGTTQPSQEPTIIEVLSFRGEGEVPGDPSYLIFKGPPGQTLYSMPMYLEAGGWKVGLALPAELPV